MDNPQSKTIEFQFAFGGMITKQDPATLSNGTYRYGLNLTSNQEGTISSRNGTKWVGSSPPGATPCYIIRKLTTLYGEQPYQPHNNPRYCGIITGGTSRDIYRTPTVGGIAYVNFIKVATAVEPLAPTTFTTFPYRHWEMADYAAGESGTAWAYFACPNFMLKDNGINPFTPLQAWGIQQAPGVASAAVNGAGNLDGGTNQSPNNSQPYDWIWTLQEASTGDEGNPSQAMVQTFACHLQSVQVTVVGVQDTARFPTFNVYRRGGILTDGIYRFIGSVANPGYAGGIPSVGTIVDNTSDADLVYSPRQAQFDNFPPVPSTVASPIRSTLAAAIGPFGLATITTTSPMFANVTPGTLLNINDAPGSIESVVLFQVLSPTSAYAWVQFSHAMGVPLQIDFISGQPCNLAVTMGDAIAVAGDPNNPHMLYLSKNGQPQAFPVGTDTAGAIKNLGVGTPSNGIANMVEFRGQLLCMNVQALYEVAVIQGYLIGPQKVADRGLIAQSAWCKTETEIWILGTDGVYSWDGGTFRKRSEQIDPIFHNQEYNGVYPISMAPVDLAAARMEYERGRVRLLFTSIPLSGPGTGVVQELVCEPRFNDRWVIYEENVPPAFGSGLTAPAPVTEIYLERDSQWLITTANVNGTSIGAVFAISDTSLVDTIVSPITFPNTNFTADYWLTNPFVDGLPIPWDLRLPWFDMGNPQGKKLFEEVWLDIDPQLYAAVYNYNSTITVELLLDYSDVPVDTFTLTIPAGNTLAGRTLLSLLPNMPVGTPVQSYGREARAISFHISGSAFPIPMTLYRLTFQYQDTGTLTAGGSTDWMDLAVPTDKRLYEMSVVFDVAGVNQQVSLDTMIGIDGNTPGPSQVFTLANPVVLGSSRALKVFPLAVDTIVKLVRVRPYATATSNGVSASQFFRILKVDFPGMEPFPPDKILATPWRDVQSNEEKNPTVVTIDMDTNGVACPTVLQNESGTAMTFTHTGTVDNRKATYPIPPDIFARMWRLLPSAGTGGKSQLFSWTFDRWQPVPNASPIDPSPVILWTPWTDFSSPYEKLARNLIIEINTGGVPCSVQPQADGANIGPPFVITTTYTNRQMVLPFESDLLGILWRLILTPGVGGLAQLWNWNIEAIKEPPKVDYWDSYQLAFGSLGWKAIKQLWIQYISPEPICVLIYRDFDQLFYSTTLPAHPWRDVERFYLPSFTTVPNKSRTYRIQLTSAGRFKTYADDSGIELMIFATDRRGAYHRFTFNQFSQFQV